MTRDLPPLRLESADRHSWVEIQPWTDATGMYSAFRMEAVVDYGHGKFTAQNRDVQFMQIAEFSREFDQFILDRSRTPVLCGTYDSHLGFAAVGLQVVVTFCIGDAFCGGLTSIEEPRLRSSFGVDSERLNDLNEYFRNLASG